MSIGYIVRGVFGPRGRKNLVKVFCFYRVMSDGRGVASISGVEVVQGAHVVVQYFWVDPVVFDLYPAFVVGVGGVCDDALGVNRAGCEQHISEPIARGFGIVQISHDADAIDGVGIG